MHSNFVDLEQDRANEPLSDAFEQGRQQHKAEILALIEEILDVWNTHPVPNDAQSDSHGWVRAGAKEFASQLKKEIQNEPTNRENPA